MLFIHPGRMRSPIRIIGPHQPLCPVRVLQCFSYDNVKGIINFVPVLCASRRQGVIRDKISRIM
jgi:hypothetical protein